MNRRSDHERVATTSGVEQWVDGINSELHQAVDGRQLNFRRRGATEPRKVGNGSVQRIVE